MAERVAIVGCGLIGGSLLRALHARGESVLAIETDEATGHAIEQLGIPVSTTTDAIVDASIVVLALPVATLLDQLPFVGAVVTQSCIVTDVAGVKVPVLEAMRRTLTGRASFVGGHPMAGKERGGFGESDAALFEGRVVALCADESAALDRVAAMWRSVGARTVVCSAEAHDAAVARISHLPYLVAAALSSVAARGDALSLELAAGGLRDTTRVAEDPTIRQALVANGNVAALAREVAGELTALADALDEHRSLDAALDSAAAARRRMFGNRSR